jgi:hypothetical protein
MNSTKDAVEAVEAELIRRGRAIRFGKPAAIDIRSPRGSVLLVLALMALAGNSSTLPSGWGKRPKGESDG